MMRLPLQAPPVSARGRTTVRAKSGVVPQDSCSVCTDILAGVIYAAATRITCAAGCATVGTLAAGACDAAFGGPEDPIGDVVCPVVGGAVTAICNNSGCSNLESWSGAQSAAQSVCTQVNIC